MDPLLRARAQALAPLFLGLLITAGVTVLHLALFQPLERRYRALVTEAGPLAAALDPSRAPRSLPPRVHALVRDHARPADEVTRAAQSGTLAAGLMQDLAALAGGHRLDVLVSEPGVLTQGERHAQVRAHLRLRGRHEDLVRFLSAIAQRGDLDRLERMTLTPLGNGRLDIEVHFARLVLKRPEARS
jgi:hypothetical protein